MEYVAPQQATSTTGKKLHFGCFDQPHAGWINTDITPHLWVTRIPLLPDLLHRMGKMTAERLAQHKQGVFRQVTKLDVTIRFPYDNDTFDAAFSSHVLEHLYPDQARHCVEEVYRILRPGGVLRVSVPDLDRVIAEYDPDDSDAWVEAFLESRQPRDKNRHNWMYNETSMGRLLREAGFSEVYRCTYQQGHCPDVETIDNRPHSLFMEGIK